ncbi:hypothetical protein CN918_29315 [Priestia megaterium]|nr:hypothetical protein CN918_29315 [Priestia megaterium]
MNVTNELVSFLEKHNGPYGDSYKEKEFRIYYVINEKTIVNAFCINRENHTLAQANQLVQELMNIMYDSSFRAEYTRQITKKQINPSEYTGKYEYLEHQPSLYIM